MFHMMNEARISIGMAATMLGLAGYHASLDYAQSRPQGRPIGAGGKDATRPQSRIIEHADVKRMLLAQKSYCEGALALNLFCARLVDEQHTGTPTRYWPGPGWTCRWPCWTRTPPWPLPPMPAAWPPCATSSVTNCPE
jgi:alkylation response protein AidB-like acyl-CoA dehydrogenase